MLEQRLVVLESSQHELPVFVHELDAFDALLLLEHDFTPNVFGTQHQ